MSRVGFILLGLRGRELPIIISEECKEEFKQVMNWSEEHFQQRTKVRLSK